MIITPTYHSKFYKADRRVNELHGKCNSYTSGLNEAILAKDIFLQGGADMTLTPAPLGHNILFPIVGSLSVEGATTATIATGDVLVLGSDAVTIRNPYEDETVNFLHIAYNAGVDAAQPFTISNININEKNRLITGEGFTANMSVGVYDSRVKGIVDMKQKDSSLFAYVINGSFEIDGRLMEYRDGLFRWDIEEEIDFEALSETAIVLFIECSPLK